ncbi:MAG: hypothetical protein JWN11_1864 [Hyphomicrobiales bacterium]|nr:hypothetical protein [Hyphomicrobiales bacterium]
MKSWTGLEQGESGIQVRGNRAVSRFVQSLPMVSASRTLPPTAVAVGCHPASRTGHEHVWHGRTGVSSSNPPTQGQLVEYIMKRLRILAFIALAAAIPATAAMADSVSARILADANASMSVGGTSCPTGPANVHASTTLGVSRALNCTLSNNAAAIAALNAGMPANSAPSFTSGPGPIALPSMQAQ